MRHNRHIGEVHAVTARRHVDGQIDEGDFAIDGFDRRQAGVGDGGIGSFKIGFRDFEQVAWYHHADAPKTAGAPGAIPGDAAVLNLEQLIGTTIFEDIPVRGLILALEILRMPERRIGHAVFRVPTEMDIMLTTFRLRTDAEIFDRAADHPQRMAFEMRQGDQHVGGSDGLRDIGFFQNVAFGEVDVIVAGANEPIGDDERAAQCGGCEAVAFGGHQQVQLGSARGVRRIGQGRGITDERASPSSFTLSARARGYTGRRYAVLLYSPQ